MPSTITVVKSMQKCQSRMIRVTMSNRLAFLPAYISDLNSELV